MLRSRLEQQIRIDPIPLLARARASMFPAPKATFTAVYSRSAADTLLPLVEDAFEARWRVRLWCLDEPAPVLAKFTVGQGPGTRGAHFNRLAADAPPDHWLVQCDDDVAMKRKDLVNWLTLAARLRLDIAQPGHSAGSYAAHSIVRRTRRYLARESTFVEMGPLIAFSPTARPHVPLLPERGFGWGYELELCALGERGFRLGIVDATPMLHLRAPASSYDFAEEHETMERRFHDRGVAGWSEVQRVTRVHRWV